MTDADVISFAQARPRLLRIARRVLVNPHDADDIVQDAWVRWQETDRAVVREPAAFLTTTTMRLAINLGQSARARRETATGSWPAETIDPHNDPAHGAEQGEELALALQMLLERLSPTERAVYILREAFDYPHRRIAHVLGLSEANVRQIVTRARRRLSGDRRGELDPTAHARLLDAFLAATQHGELEALEELLAEDTRPALSLAA
jgi:RNA polymerase sigma-70 factor (ECF subfamily)